MDFRNALTMVGMGVPMTRLAWETDDTVMIKPDEDLVVVRSLDDPATDISPTDEDMAANDWEVRRG